jgi:hypothetical protein
VGQTGRVCRRWYQQGVRPRGHRDFRHEAVWLCGAVCPARDTGVALVLPRSDTTAMQLLLDELAKVVEPGAHAVVLLDRAGGHTTENLAVAGNLTLALLPSSSPALNPIERLWLYLRERFLSHGVWPAYRDIVDACCRAWNAVRAEAGRIRSLCSSDWAPSVRI